MVLELKLLQKFRKHSVWCLSSSTSSSVCHPGLSYFRKGFSLQAGDWIYWISSFHPCTLETNLSLLQSHLWSTTWFHVSSWTGNPLIERGEGGLKWRDRRREREREREAGKTVVIGGVNRIWQYREWKIIGYQKVAAKYYQISLIWAWGAYSQKWKV